MSPIQQVDNKVNTQIESIEQKQSDLYKLFLTRVYQQFSKIPQIDISELFDGIEINTDIEVNRDNNYQVLPEEINVFLRRATSFFAFNDFTNQDLSRKTLDVDSNIFLVIEDILTEDQTFTKEDLAQALYKLILEFPNEEIRKVLLKLFPDAGFIIRLIELDSFSITEGLISQFLTQSLMLAIAFEYNVAPSSYELSEYLKKDNSDYLLKKKRLLENTVEHVVEIKSRELPPPSPNLRFSLQIPAYNELPLRVTEINRRGNISDQLMSIINAAEHYGSTSGDISEIEVLINVNNSSEQSFELNGEQINGTLNNYYTIKLIEIINNEQITVEEALQILTEDLMLLDESSQDYNLLLNYYKQFLIKARAAVKKGLRIYTIDCTDGTYISRKDDNSPILNTPNQAARRLLLSEIAKRRFSSSSTEEDQLHIFLDADIRLNKKYFNAIKQKFSGGRDSNPKAILLPLRIVAPESYDVDTGNTELDRTSAKEITSAYREYFYYRDFILATRAITKKEKSERLNRFTRPIKRLFTKERRVDASHIFTPFLETVVVNNSAHSNGGDWGLYKGTSKGGGEDTNYCTSLIDSGTQFEYLETSLTSRVHRIRQESWGGRISTWKHNGEGFGLVFKKNTQRAVLHYYKFLRRNFRIDYTKRADSITPEEFIDSIIEAFNTVKGLTLQERTMLLKHGFLKYNHYIGINDIDYNRAIYGNRELPLKLFRLIALSRDLSQLNTLVNYPNISSMLSNLSRFVNEEIQRSVAEGTYQKGDDEPVTLYIK